MACHNSREFTLKLIEVPSAVAVTIASTSSGLCREVSLRLEISQVSNFTESMFIGRISHQHHHEVVECLDTDSTRSNEWTFWKHLTLLRRHFTRQDPGSSNRRRAYQDSLVDGRQCVACNRFNEIRWPVRENWCFRVCLTQCFPQEMCRKNGFTSSELWLEGIGPELRLDTIATRRGPRLLASHMFIRDLVLYGSTRSSSRETCRGAMLADVDVSIVVGLRAVGCTCWKFFVLYEVTT